MLDAYAVATREVPDRERPEDTQNGLGVFARGAVERGGWRTHVIVWRSRDTLKEEGDANYLMLRRDGRFFRKIRDYGELGVTRHFYPLPACSSMQPCACIASSRTTSIPTASSRGFS